MTVWNRGSGLSTSVRPDLLQHRARREINRTSPKTQSALLEAMGERQVTVDTTTHKLASPFMVIATQTRSSTRAPTPAREPARSILDEDLRRLSGAFRPNSTSSIVMAAAIR